MIEAVLHLPLIFPVSDPVKFRSTAHVIVFPITFHKFLFLLFLASLYGVALRIIFLGATWHTQVVSNPV